MTTSVIRPCFTKQHQTCKTKTTTEFFVSDWSCPRPTVSDHITDGETDGHRPTAKTARLYAYRRAVKITQVIGRLVHTSHHHEFTAECTVHERAGIQQDVRA